MCSAEDEIARRTERSMFADMEARAAARARYEQDLAAYRERSRAIFDAWERRIDAGHRMTEQDVALVMRELDAIRPVEPPMSPIEQTLAQMGEAAAAIGAAKRKPTALDRYLCYDFGPLLVPRIARSGAAKSRS